MTMSQPVLIFLLTGLEYRSGTINLHNFVLFFISQSRNASHALAYFSVTLF